ncbi:general stress protein [Williamsia sp.]|uniref:general stress protein n=1 Tax=Williamsia sp. TaxID=1872085 RepID=UPI001A1E4670|nr:general stress protein [Williamsia sp.]MBJ7287929.1 magnesium transporter [Williamsia sp.]
MTNILHGSHRPTPMSTPLPPTGTQIGSYLTYADAQAAVELLTADDFPVANVSIVGVDLVQVERVTGRLTWTKVITGGVVVGGWLGIFIGMMLGFFTGELLWPLVVGVVMGVAFGVTMFALPYAAIHGMRDFTSTMQLVAGHYDLVCTPATADNARSLLTRD